MNRCSAIRIRLILVLGAVISICAACSDRPASTPDTSSKVTSITTLAKGAEIAKLPRNGKLRSATAPPKALFGMIYINSSNNSEYIFDGAQWVPHDKTIDSFYPDKFSAKSSDKTVSLTGEDACSSYDCNPGGAHRKHAAFSCTDCHMMHGSSRFDPNGPAVIKSSATNPNPPLPMFDAAGKTCSNIACHSVPTGTFSYYFQDGSGEPALTTVTYGSAATGATSPSWYALSSSGACTACHLNPPVNGSNGSNVWHSGMHAGSVSTASNQCQFCHPDATGINGRGGAVTNAALHGNGTVEVQARFTSSCFGCH